MPTEIGKYSIPAAQVGSVLGDAEIAALTDLIRSGATLSQGPLREEFEQRLRAHIGTRHALTVTSGTVALAIAVHLLDLRPGDEVIVTPQSFKATAEPLLAHEKVAVRFCDVDPDTLNIDSAAFEALITPRTKALLLVHYGGRPAEMREIMAIARRHGVLVVEDCAHALGSEYRGGRPGSLGDIGCFSFHSTKNISSLGEGGMITFDRDDWAERVDRIRSNAVDGDYVSKPLHVGHGRQPWMMWVDDSYENICSTVRAPGSNATMSEAGAAVGLVQLDRLDALVSRRQEIAARYAEVLGAVPGVRLPEVPPEVNHPYHLFTFFVRPESEVGRDAVVAALEEAGIQVQLRYFPLHLRPEWRGRGHRYGECPVAERLWFREQVNLPCHPSLTDDQVEYVVSSLRTALRAPRSRRPMTATSR
ncbi:DegT/DnrJ/EryC1/StrS aminotransferase family protein [Streptomyces sp. HPF1205]|uniref:DegT/DnrJ/EryC1/StrS family aminotransferase n=1 Tax=Streptomyces sp. HPF1205 TaxID=2873262 RepID=UPI001CEC1D72|nr:DegT/DnrJ/EryC1/StrS family aminotransferase [Streptomyces sp. HPF1205]